jgi:predicted DNA binding CopG/RHH family protein
VGQPSGAQLYEKSIGRGASERYQGERLELTDKAPEHEKRSVQIAIRIPEADLKQARTIADRKGIGYQTLLKMLVHEGLKREA